MNSINQATRNYEIYGQQATDNGFRPGSGEWWAELRRLRSEAHQQKIDGIVVVDDMSADLQPGMFVTCRLGNPGDIDWSPKATVLLLYTNVTHSGPVQFTGLYKHADGSQWIARFVTKSYLRRRMEQGGDVDSGQEQGMMYCTSSVPVNESTRSSDYLSESENDTLDWAMRHHRNKIEQLPVSLRYKNDKCVDSVAQ